MVNADGKTLFFSAVELYQECGREKGISDERLFSTRENAIAYLRKRHSVVVANCGEDLFSEDFSEDGWFSVVNADGDTYEGYVSEGLEVDRA